MQRKIIVFVCVVLVVVLGLSSASVVKNRSEFQAKESKIEPTVNHFIEIVNNAHDPEHKAMYWEILSQQSKDRLIQQTGSLDAAQREVWILLQEIADSQKYVELLNIEYVEIRGNIATVVMIVRITEAGKDPVETDALHKYRWENDEWKFIDWSIEPEIYEG